MPNYNILLVPGEQKWTSKALHLACAMARSNEGRVTLLTMTPAGHPALLGSPEGHRNVTDDELLTLAELATTAEKYKVPVIVTVCQYASYWRALVSAVEQLEATALFAVLPASHISVWARFQQWRIEHSLAHFGCTLYTVEPSGGPLEWTPSATQAASGSSIPHGKESQV